MRCEVKSEQALTAARGRPLKDWLAGAIGEGPVAQVVRAHA
jgi:hypothetical protein